MNHAKIQTEKRKPTNNTIHFGTIDGSLAEIRIFFLFTKIQIPEQLKINPVFKSKKFNIFKRL